VDCAALPSMPNVAFTVEGVLFRASPRNSTFFASHKGRPRCASVGSIGFDIPAPIGPLW